MTRAYLLDAVADGTATAGEYARAVREEPLVSVLIPIRTVSALNMREHHMARHRRVEKERSATRFCLNAYAVKPKRRPVVVLLTRLSPGTLDDDNLRGAAKGCRDEIAKWLGIDDGDESAATWMYAQEKCKRGEFGVRVEIRRRA